MVGLEYGDIPKNKTLTAKIKGLLARKPIIGKISRVFYSCYSDELSKEHRKYIKPFACYMTNPIYKIIILTNKKYCTAHKNAYNSLRVLLNRY